MGCSATAIVRFVCRMGLLVLLTAATACTDQVFVQDVEEGEDFGILLDGNHESGSIATDEVHRSTDSPLEFRLTARPFDSEELVDQIVAFSRDRAVVSRRGKWTGGKDVRTLALPGAIVLPIVVWVVTGPYDDRDPVSLVEEANAFFYAERAGVILELARGSIRDVTAKGNGSQYQAIQLSEFEKGHAENDFRALLGWESGKINVYLTDEAPAPDSSSYSSETTGWTFETKEEGKTVLVLGKQATGALLAHEVGHALDLHHVDYKLGSVRKFYDKFDKTNVMCSFGAARAYVTEGQTFRAHFSEVIVQVLRKTGAHDTSF